MTVLVLRRLVAGRGDLALTDPIDLTLRAGQALVVTGENGAGKSTLLRTLAGLLPPLAGAVDVKGAVPGEGAAATRAGEVAHYLGHRNALKPGLSLAGNLGFWQRFLGGRPNTDAIEAALDALGLDGLDAVPAGQLSAGQARRASLAKLLVASRALWLLDEPTTALDAASEARFAALAAVHLGAGGVLVAATHRPLDLPGAASLRLQRRTRIADAGDAW